MSDIITEYDDFLSAEECIRIINGESTDFLVARLSSKLQIDAARFEPVVISEFKRGQGLSKHVDYFTGAGLDYLCANGGNRFFIWKFKNGIVVVQNIQICANLE
jgi:hypothetical protein